MKCPACGEEVEKFLKKKRSSYALCPKCRKGILLKNLPPEVVEVVERYPWEPEGSTSNEEDIEEVVQEEPKERRYEPIFEVPKEPTRIIEEVLKDWGIDEDFIRHVVRHVERKGMLETSWLFNMLTKGRTGRKVIPDEALMIIEEILSAIENERRKAESMGMPYVPLQVVDLRDRTIHVPSFHLPLQQQHQYQFYGLHVPHQPQSFGYQSVQPFQIQPQQTQIPQYQNQVLSPDAIKSIVASEVSKLLEEKRRQDEISELRRKVYEEVPQMVRSETEKIKQEIMQTIKELSDSIKAAIQQQPKQVEPSITKKDLEEIIEKLEKRELQKSLDELKKVLEEKTQPIIVQPPSSEGYQNDGARLIADTIKMLVAPNQWYPGRAIENLIRVLPQIQQPPQKEVPPSGGKTIFDMIKESGGEVV